MSVTDTDVLTEVQLTLQEDATFSNGLWSLAEVIAYFNQRQYRFLFETKVVAAVADLPWTPGTPQQDLPTDFIAMIAAGWIDLEASRWYPLPASDRFETDHIRSPEETTTPGPPMAHRTLDTTDTLTVAIDPIPIAPGTFTMTYVALSEVLDGLGTYFTIPDDWTVYLKYGVYADMLSKIGRGQDLTRARYCEQRYQEGIILAQVLLQGWP
jgi:hypothetical protein